eukprot:CAMPEP_0195528142 /NCGR_PEP_ID=MMETSP0794_2-20130614/30171_1 /TAXON_ID=515487 /ORGANISM="Stephanopyxis turris, Strain CCMP 815" /LENGTH=632 /DNA_ID=CAMNT_0040659219 /DNA_START=409 /DNA_END=2303 /DNA_ORIENTATION=+
MALIDLKASITPTDEFNGSFLNLSLDSARGLDSASAAQHRLSQTDETETSNCPPKADPTWFLTWYIIGVLYMFVALAIVCDEFFVPALEEMADEKHLDLSMDIAGATLMAAGGSAPELFTSFFGTFNESAVGFGTIVGSAVFNVLFVIASCAFFTKEALQLTWWPLFRDCTYYVISLVVLAVFVGVVTKGKVVWWEALILLGMYVGYVVLMYFNETLHKLLTGKELGRAEQEKGEEKKESKREVEMSNMVQNGSEESSPLAQQEEGARRESLLEVQAISIKSLHAERAWPGTFRAGVLKLLRDPDSWSETAGVGLVAQIEGDVDAVFKHVDKNGDGSIETSEMHELFVELDCHLTPEQVREAMQEIDTDGDGKICKTEFNVWYIRSEQRILSQVQDTFDRFDADNSGTIDHDEVKKLLETIEPRVDDNDVRDALCAMYQSGSHDEITFQEFSDWYTSSLIFQRKKQHIEEEMAGVFEFVRPPKKCSVAKYLKWIIVLPILLVLTLTIPDVRVMGLGKFAKIKNKVCYVAFILSITWIGIFSFFMVQWTEIIGATLRIPSIVMGLTFLAAGTSIPDLLSSIIVARRGQGDMAISSSIGSNIFDILIGLPLPWLVYTLWPSKPQYIMIEADGVW